MTITTKETAQGNVSSYFIDGQRVKKIEVEDRIYQAAQEGEIIEVDYYTAQQFRSITRSPYRNLKVVFSNSYNKNLMTEAAANELGATIIKRFTSFNSCLDIYCVEMPALIEPNIDDYAVTVEAQDAAIDAEIALANNSADETVNVENLTANQKLAAQIVARLGNLIVKCESGEYGTRKGQVISYETFVDKKDEFGTNLYFREVFTDEDSFILDHVNLIKGYGEDKTVETFYFTKHVAKNPMETIQTVDDFETKLAELQASFVDVRYLLAEIELVTDDIRSLLAELKLATEYLDKCFEKLRHASEKLNKANNTGQMIKLKPNLLIKTAA